MHILVCNDEVARQRAAVVAEARTWLGTPFHHAARIKGAGVDCAQFLIAVFCALGLVGEPPVDAYPTDWFLHQDGERLLEHVAAACHLTDTPAPGDIALYRYGRSLSHAAIVTAIEPSLVVVHSYRGLGVIEEDAGPNTPLYARCGGYWTLSRWVGPLLEVP